MKRHATLLIITLFSLGARANIDTVLVWNGYYQFLAPSGGTSDSTNTIIELGDTIVWLQFDAATMAHTITSTNIPSGAASFDVPFVQPSDTFFQYIPTEVGVYEYECTPHINFNMIASFRVIPSTSIEEPNKAKIEIYPNPATSVLQINGIQTGEDVSIFSSAGKLVKRIDYNGSIDVEDLPNGMYFIRTREITSPFAIRH